VARILFKMESMITAVQFTAIEPSLGLDCNIIDSSNPLWFDFQCKLSLYLFVSTYCHSLVACIYLFVRMISNKFHLILNN